MIKIDGAAIESGGQILRTACGLSAITQTPCHILNIGNGREKPGLTTQHLLNIQAVSQLCNGKLEGDFLGSKEIKFYPGKIKSKNIQIKINTADGLTLLMQTIFLPAFFGQSSIEITYEGGATDTFFSPTLDYFRFVFLKTLEKLGLKAEVNIFTRGYYPEGGAKLKTIIHPCFNKIKPIFLIKPESLEKIKIISGAADSLKSKKVAERQVAGVKEVLGKLKLPIKETIEYYQTQCPGSQICLISEFKNAIIGTDNLGKLGERAEDIGKKAALELLKEQKLNACFDRHLADQILPYLALAQKKSQITVSEITKHCQANIQVIESFLNGKFNIEENLISWNPR